MTDLAALVSAIGGAAPDAPLRLRRGVIQSVAADYTVSVKIGGSDTVITGVKVASSCCPNPGASVWLATDGRDWFVLCALAPNGPAWAAMRKSTAQSIPDSTWTDLTWGSRTDAVTNISAPTSMLDTAGLVCVVPGLYQVSGSVDFVANSTGQRHSVLSVNSATVLQGTGGDRAAGGDVSRLRADGILRLTPGDKVTLTAYQSSGAALNTSVGAGFNMIRMVWLGPAA